MKRWASASLANGPPRATPFARRRRGLVDEAKDFLATPEAERERALPEFCERLSGRIGALEALLPVE